MKIEKQDTSFFSNFVNLEKILKSTIIKNPEIKVFASKTDDLNNNFSAKKINNYIAEYTKNFDGNEEAS